MAFAEFCTFNRVNMAIATLFNYISKCLVLKAGERRYNYTDSGEREYVLITVSKVLLLDFCYENCCPEGKL